MNTKGLSQIIMVVLLMMGIFFITVNILTGSGSNLGEAGKYFAILLGLACFFNGKAGLYILPVVLVYSDFVKKLLIYEGRFDMQDITMILTIGPVASSGVFGYFLVGGLLGSVRLRKENVILLIACFALIAIGSAIGLRIHGPTIAAAKWVTYNAFYAIFLFVIPLAFPTTGELLKYFRFWLIILFPAAVYGVYHGFFGMTALEYAYLDSGFSIEERHLYAAVPRPPGPFSSARALSVCMGATAGLALVYARLTGRSCLSAWRKPRPG